MKAVDHGGVAVTSAKMAFGNGLGIHSWKTCPSPNSSATSTAPSLWKLRRKKHSACQEPHKVWGAYRRYHVEKLYGGIHRSLRIFCRPLTEKPLDLIFPRRAESIDKPSPVFCGNKGYSSSTSIPTFPDPGYSFLPCPATTAKWTVPEPLNGPAPFRYFHL